MQSKVRDAFFVRFRVAPDGLCTTEEAEEHGDDSLQCGVGVLDESGVFSFFDVSGNDYRVRIEFAVERIVPLRVGVLIERKWSPGVASSSGDNIVGTLLYYLQHPLDLINAVVAVANGKNSIMRFTVTIISTNILSFLRNCGVIKILITFQRTVAARIVQLRFAIINSWRTCNAAKVSKLPTQNRRQRKRTGSHK